MQTLATRPKAQGKAPARDGPVASVLRPVGRFVLHFLEMCGVMCVGAITLSVLFFGGAALLGYDNLPQRFTELSVLVIAIFLSAPMAVYMRFRGMAWRPTLEMSSTTMVVGLALIAAYWLGLVAKGSLIEVQTALACPLMLPIMLFRFRLYSGHGGHHAQRDDRTVPIRRRLARFNRNVANPVIRLLARWLPPLAIIKHRGRVTGRDHATPVLAFRTGDGLAVGVLYGTESDWLHNVLAAGHAEVRRLGTVHEYGNPRLVGSDEGLPLVPVAVRGAYRILGVRGFLRITASSPDQVAQRRRAAPTT